MNGETSSPLGLSRGAARLLAALGLLSAGRPIFEVSQGFLGAHLNLSIRMVYSYTRELEEAGLVTTQRRQAKSMLYTLNTSPARPEESFQSEDDPDRKETSDQEDIETGGKRTADAVEKQQPLARTRENVDDGGEFVPWDGCKWI